MVITAQTTSEVSREEEQCKKCQTMHSFVSKRCGVRESMCVCVTLHICSGLYECHCVLVWVPPWPFDLLVHLKWIHNTLFLIKLQICEIELRSLQSALQSTDHLSQLSVKSVTAISLIGSVLDLFACSFDQAAALSAFLLD